jgi:hypothetical protein
MRRLAWILTCGLCVAGFPQVAGANNCSLAGQYVASAPLDAPPYDEVPLVFIFTPPTSCASFPLDGGAPNTVKITGTLWTPGQSQPEQFELTAPYEVAADGRLLITLAPGRVLAGRSRDRA